MGSTPNLNLYKGTPGSTTETFNVQTMMNDNWDKLDTEVPKKASTTEDGRMSKEDKTKLNTVEEGANNYTHPATHSPSIISQDANNRFVTDAEKVAWDSKAEGNHTHTPASIGAETPAGAQAKSDAVQANLDAHLVDLAAQDVGKGADAIGLPDPDNLFTATNLREGMYELFTSVSSGKQQVATAITDKGGTVVDADGDGISTFQELSDGLDTLYKKGDPVSFREFGMYLGVASSLVSGVYSIKGSDNGFFTLDASDISFYRSVDGKLLGNTYQAFYSVAFCKDYIYGTIPINSEVVIYDANSFSQLKVVTMSSETSSYIKAVPNSNDFLHAKSTSLIRQTYNGITISNRYTVTIGAGFRFIVNTVTNKIYTLDTTGNMKRIDLNTGVVELSVASGVVTSSDKNIGTDEYGNIYFLNSAGSTLYKYNPSLNMVWSKTIGSTGYDTYCFPYANEVAIRVGYYPFFYVYDLDGNILTNTLYFSRGTTAGYSNLDYIQGYIISSWRNNNVSPDTFGINAIRMILQK